MDSFIRCMTFNLRCVVPGDGMNNWPYRIALVEKTIHRLHPDFLGTQEVTDQMASDLENPLAAYHVVGDGRNADRHGERCSLYVLASRWTIEHHETIWLTDTPYLSGSADPEEGYPRICTMAVVQDKTSAQRYLLMNVHLAFQSSRARKQNLATLIHFFHEWKDRYLCPVILMGDFNAEPSHFIHAALQAEGLISGCDAMHAIPRPTYHAFLGGDGLETIDYIYATPALTFASWVVDTYAEQGRYPSDHYPVVVDFKPTK
jgi:endonuclease/exonuclease/phosphatase family metal-dependent hydrolase